MAAMCIGLVGTGLFMSLAPGEAGLVLDKPGTPGRLVADSSIATAFFELEGEQMELTMLFSDEEEPDSVFRTRVTLMNGQSHSIVVADSEDGSDAQRFTFLRTGDSLTMSLAPATATMTASYTPNQ
jgi:hypothetical protein